MSLLIRTIISSTWAIREDVAIGYAPMIQKILSGESVSLEGIKSKEAASGYSDPNREMVIGILPIKGVITKNDFCGDMGTVSFDKQLQEFIKDDSIGAIILDLDTPGGETSYLENLATTIKNSPKPILTHVCGMCCSAGYYIASNSTAIYASAKSDMIGSIGTMISIYRPNEEKQKDQSYVLTRIYATKSTKKNEPFEAAQRGEYDIIKSDLLDPVNDIFHEFVKSGRPNANEEVFTGKAFYASEAIEMGLVDGIKSFEQVIEAAYSLIKNNEPMGIFKSKNRMSKKMEKVSSILGRDVMENEQLSAEDLTAIENAMATPAAVQQEQTTSAEEIQAAVTAAVQGSVPQLIQEALAPIQTSMEGLIERVGALEEEPGAAPATTAPTAGGTAPDYSLKPWENPENSLNKEANAALGLK
jgi:protease-4